MKTTLIACVALLWVSGTFAAGASCTAHSGSTLVPLVELYTSEGCSSCPPADRWLSATFAAGRREPAVAVLAFHVDYWDRLGWTDRFAAPAFTARQHAAMRANGATFVYTPQVLLQGRDVAPGRRGRVADDVSRLGATAPRARISIDAGAGAAAATVRVSASLDAALPDAQLWLVQADSGHATQVRAGENRGTRLVHDHVVRALHGPYPVDGHGTASASIHLTGVPEPGQAPVLVAFVQRERTGEVLQSLVLPLDRACGP